MTKTFEGITKQTNGMSHVIQLYIGESNLYTGHFPCEFFLGREREREKEILPRSG